MARKTTMINGVDFTDYFPPAGLEISYIEEGGSNAGISILGSTIKDVLAVKAVVSSPLMPLTEEQQGYFLRTLMGSGDFVSLYYFEPSIEGYRTAAMSYEISKTKHRGTGADGNEYWTGLSVKFTDRYDMRRQ